MNRIATAIIAAALLAPLAGPAAPAGAASRFVINGAGFGHGVGMSQYGALGYARQGADYRAILAHYYTGTELSPYAGSPTVRVLLQSGRRLSFTGARAAAGRKLNPSSTYSAVPTSLGRVALRSAHGRTLATADSPMRVSGGGQPWVLKGAATNGLRDGRYRGALELRATAVGGLLAVDAVSLEDYVRGVVSAESPSSWPAAALEAQAVAARTYAVTTDKDGNGFDQYADTRSQMYRGVAAEFASTDAAVDATRGQVVTYQGTPAATFFFSTSGGRTEDVQNAFPGSAPKPWLVSVADPYDSVSPWHRWGPLTYTLTQADRKLGRLAKGTFRGIDVVQRGESPRILEADVLGSRGKTRVTGSQLRSAFGTRDTWMTFSLITSKGTTKPAGDDGGAAPTEPPADADPTSGGTAPAPSASAAQTPATWAPGAVTGRVMPATRGARIALQRRVGHAWRSAGAARVAARGRYRFAGLRPGLYRVLWRGTAGPAVRIR